MSDSEAPLLSPPDNVASEVEVDADLLRRLLRGQHKDLADERVEPFAEGWDNVLFRIGTRWLARLPRRAVAAPLVAQEARWLPILAPHLPLETPIPERLGRPTEDYPFPFTISRWIEGTPAAGTELDPDAVARDLAAFLAALHGLVAKRLFSVEDAPVSEVRGVSPRVRSEFLLERLRSDRVCPLVEADRLEALWSELIETPDWDGPPVWCHGDLHPFNMLARDGRLVAVLDWGDMHVREPAPDLASAWMMIPVSRHTAFRAAYGELDQATWLRGKAWALYLGVMFLDAGAGGAGEAATRVGHETLARVLA